MSTLDRDDFRAAGHRIVDMLADHWRSLPDRRIAPAADVDELVARFEDTLPSEGIGLAAMCDELPRVLENCIAMSHPLYLGLVNSSPLAEAVLGDLVVAAVDNNGGASHQGPANLAAERAVVRWLARGLQYEGDGMILAGGSQATLQALQIAKFCRFPQWVRQGPQTLTALPRVYLSEATHFCSARAALAIGLGESCIVTVPGAGRGEMDPETLRLLIRQDLEAGHQPFAVIATSGSTGTGALDPLEPISEICQELGVWLHVDACYGGAAALLDAYRHLFTGIELADSVAVDLHKWFFMPLTSGVLLTRHEDQARELFRIDAAYIPTTSRAEAYCRGLPTSRRAAGLTAWFALRAAGWNTVRDAIERNIHLTRDLEQQLAARGFRVLPHGELSIACARWEPAGWEPAQLNQLQQDIARELCQDGRAWFATAQCDRRIWLRFNLVNLHTQQQHIDQLVQLVVDAAKRLA